MKDNHGFAEVEALLRHRHPKEDTAALGKALQDRFVSPSAMYEASPFSLERAGLHPHDALLVSVLADLSRLAQYDQFGPHPQLGRLPLASKYLINTFRGIYVEQFYLLCLDPRGRLTRREMINEGSEDTAIFNLRKILEIVVQTSPAGIIIAHNHPALTLCPSNEDIGCTMRLICALSALSVPLLDHLIIAGPDAVSLRENGFVPPYLWLLQNPKSKLLANWLSTENMPKGSYKLD